ncbi:hypothetical protein ALC62_08887, partial [Cyphomyrmex costatus]
IPERHKLIQIKSKGYLMNPSVALFHLLSTAEKGVIEATQYGEINADMLFEIMELINEEKNPVTFLGCEKHNYEFTKNIRFYLITRMFFLTKQANRNDNVEREKTKEKRKSLKLVKTNVQNDPNMYFQIEETNAVETVIQMKKKRKRKSGKSNN